MNIHVSISPDLGQFISQQVAAGHCPSADDVIIEGLQVLREKQQKLESLRHDIDVALEQSTAGQSQVFDEKVADEIKASGRERLIRA